MAAASAATYLLEVGWKGIPACVVDGALGELADGFSAAWVAIFRVVVRNSEIFGLVV